MNICFKFIIIVYDKTLYKSLKVKYYSESKSLGSLLIISEIYKISINKIGSRLYSKYILRGEDFIIRI